jgi:exopolysaccharide biosynthesis operon protein EpsL
MSKLMMRITRFHDVRKLSLIRFTAIPAMHALPAKRLFCLVCLLGVDGIAHAGNANIFSTYVDFRSSYEDNLLRLHDAKKAVSTVGQDETSDTVKRATAGLRIDTQLSQQRLTADLNLNRSRYQRFTQFDNDGKEGVVNWNWRLGSHWEGNLGSVYSEAPAPQEDFRAGQLIVRTQRRTGFDAAWRFHPSWRVRAGVSQIDLQDALATRLINDREVEATELGMDYLSRSTSSIGLQLRHLGADYLYRPQSTQPALDNSYTQDEIKSKVEWQWSGVMRLQFLGGWVDKKFEVDTRRNFSGINARLTANWQATSTTPIKLSVWRELGALNNTTADVTANYALNRGLSLSASRDVSSKVRLRTELISENRDYQGLDVVSGIATQNRVDRFKAVTLGISYTPSRHWQSDLSAFREVLSSDVNTLSFKANGARLSVRYAFGNAL